MPCLYQKRNQAKRGLAYTDSAATTPFGTTASWAYNWDQTTGALAGGIEYVPMLWGTSSDHTGGWATNAQNAINGGSTHLLGFNEPDLSSQSNLSPADAAAAWKTYMQPFAGKAKLVSPAITNGAAPMGTAWMDSFLSACSGCTIDAIAIHIYDSATNTAYFEQYISDIGTKYGKPVWVTEFAGSGAEADQESFLKTMIPFLDGLSSVERYAYFADIEGSGLISGGALTPLGVTYSTL
ncbi:glycoside hydrolase family 128 protein [Plicaturopsis crispa FD-325 SS-3]|uniref:Glycoside hydrolase family 128 protein n=1 Tax=Plicaturopsis crispa FD-325 SS-3 TaxID=944288 RepID=A0A0C9T4X4_PLICR|nr:glycoside hydrolase family 128 protein [Plicaturopsis crispa FD-325 SS-3]